MNNSVTSCSPYAVPNLYDLQQQQKKDILKNVVTKQFWGPLTSIVCTKLTYRYTEGQVDR